MSRSGGVYTPPASSWNPAVNGASATLGDWNSLLSDISTALTQSLAVDGQTSMTGNLPMNTYKITGLGSGTARTDAVNLGQIQDSTPNYLTGVAGTNTITASLTNLAAYATGQVFRFIIANTNSGAATLNINTLGAKSITKNGTTALASGDLPINAVATVVYDGTQFQLVAVPVGYASPGANSDITSLSALTSAVKDIRQIQPISASVGSNALTISASALALEFRSTTLGSGTVSFVQGTPANLVISSGSTLGTVNATQSRIVVLALNNAGTIELAAVNIAGGNDLTETGVISTTAEGGLGAADSANVIYSTTSRSNVAYRVIGYVESTQATAGTWATAPSTIQGFGGQALAAMSTLGYGQTVQTVTGSRTSGTTYYNTTGRPIQLIVTISGDGSNNCNFTLNGSVITTFVLGNTQTSQLCNVVPPGGSYSITLAGAMAINRWIEIR